MAAPHIHPTYLHPGVAARLLQESRDRRQAFVVRRSLVAVIRARPAKENS